MTTVETLSDGQMTYPERGRFLASLTIPSTSGTYIALMALFLISLGHQL